MRTITGGGAFTAKNIADLNANFSLVEGVDFWIRPQAAVGDADGTYEKPFASFAALGSRLVTGSVVGLEGVLREQLTTTLGVNDVIVTGPYPIPRQATTSGVPNGGGATWLAPTSPVTSQALVRVQGQGWTFQNIYFNSTGITTNACIEPHTVGDPPLQADGAHLLIQGCILTGAKYGIYCPTGTNYVRLVDSEIFGFSDSGDVAIQAAGSIGTLLDWQIVRCKMFNNANGIIAALSHGTIQGCQIESGTATIDLTNGTAPNYVVGNSFNIAAADFDPAGGVTGVTGDVWSNTLTDAIETGLPAN